jgi:hypothetical protein
MLEPETILGSRAMWNAERFLGLLLFKDAYLILKHFVLQMVECTQDWDSGSRVLMSCLLLLL